MKKLALGLIALVALLYGVALLRPKLTMAELGIDAADAARCEAPQLPVYVRPGYDRRVAANDYLPYAIAALNVYPDGRPKGFTLDKHSPEWRKIDTRTPSSSLAMDVYHRDTPARLEVLVAFRGTQSLDASDWLANMSWALAWAPIATRYDEARAEFREVRKAAFKTAGTKKVAFIAAGHSLGGGLAQHIAYAYPCVSAAIFNSSFVTNQFRLAEPNTKAQIIHVFEDLDELTRLRRLLFIDKESETYKHYRQDAVNDRVEFQHSMVGLGVGMARQVLRCQEKRAECPVPASETRVRSLYCSSWGKGGPLCK
ncbi:MAG TPA: hypothetical protein PK264_10425 [Hyphomicrobiaceae bacterium]|nr:hypothetical protein [Hyphomicrobiaceae bacterium]